MDDDDLSRDAVEPAEAMPLPRSRRRRPRDERPRVEGLAALLGEIDALRTTLQADLSLAAAAVDEGADDVAVELVDSDRQAVQDFERRALGHLRELDSGETAAPHLVLSPFAPSPFAPGRPSGLRLTAPREPGRLPTARSRRRVLSAAPLAVAAAALVAFAVGLVPLPVNESPRAGYNDAALAGFTLSRLAAQGASTDEVRRAAEALNADIAALVDGAEPDLAAVQQAWALLKAGNEVLAGQSEQGPLREVLAETRSLEQQLLRLLERMPASVRPVPTLPVELPAAVDLLRSPPTSEPRDTAPRPTATADAQPAPPPEPTPSKGPVSPAPTPTAPEPTQPAPAPPQTAPEPSRAPSPPFTEPFQISEL